MPISSILIQAFCCHNQVERLPITKSCSIKTCGSVNKIQNTAGQRHDHHSVHLESTQGLTAITQEFTSFLVVAQFFIEFDRVELRSSQGSISPSVLIVNQKRWMSYLRLQLDRHSFPWLGCLIIASFQPVV